MLPTLRNAEIRPPVAGREELQVASGVGTTNVQFGGIGVGV